MSKKLVCMPISLGRASPIMLISHASLCYLMASESEINAENDFRARYVVELKKMTDKQLDDERKSVNQQGMRTPGRRGENIKHEEISRDAVRRHVLKEKAKHA